MKFSIAFVLGVCGLGMAADLGSGLQKVKVSLHPTNASKHHHNSPNQPSADLPFCISY